MCGVCGVLNLSASKRTDPSVVLQMLEMLRHRGPDGFGVYTDEHVALGNSRLCIIDLETGDQPISNEDDTLWIVLNGEIFNYIELKQELETRGHHFKTRSDTEVLLHAYEEFGVACLERLNGQFSLAIWDTLNRCLFLARDRLGITPLYYCLHGAQLIFGSEIKSLLAYPGIQAEIDPGALQQVFTYWSVQNPKTLFKGIAELPPGYYLLAKDGQIEVKAYWSLDFTQPEPPRPENETLEALESLLIDSAQLRLRSDVPVGVYLSGGLDSSIITALIQKHSNYPLETFSIAFSDPEYDESRFQMEVAEHFGARHHVVHCTYEDIGQVFPQVVWHAETALLRTAPAPMFLLSRLVNSSGYRVALTGEGADEFFGGYDIFKETLVRRFWAKNPASAFRPLLFKRLYTDIQGISSGQLDYLKAFYKKGLSETDAPFYSHALRWSNSKRNTRFLRAADALDDSPIQAFPANFAGWSPLAKAQFIETMTFLSPYLLTSQGDRMSMAHSVETRQPYLDVRLVEFCNHLPDRLKLRGLKEKWLLKRLGAKTLPESIWKKLKKPYRAPINQCFFARPPEYVQELLSEKCIDESQYFNTPAVMGLVQKASGAGKLGEVDSMAVAGVISIQLIHQLFIKDFRLAPLRSTVLKLIER